MSIESTFVVLGCGVQIAGALIFAAVLSHFERRDNRDYLHFWIWSWMVVNHDARAFGCISVADTGSGISAEHLPHIFEPFFTTKEKGEGTGLGLATSYAVIQQHDGRIDVDTEVGRGSTFHIYLPIDRSGE